MSTGLWLRANPRTPQETRTRDLSSANLSRAKYSPRTRWPDGYDPAAHGAVSL